MRDLDERFAVLDLLDPPDQWSTIERRADVEPLQRTRALWRPGWVLATAAVVTVAAIGGALLLISPTDSPPPAGTQPLPTTVSQLATTVPSLPPATAAVPAPATPLPTAPPESVPPPPTTILPPPEALKPVVWTAIPSGDAGFASGDRLHAVTRFGSQWIAAGTTSAAGTVGFWTSPDGLDWQIAAELTIDGMLDGGSGQMEATVTELVGGPDEVLALIVVWDESANQFPVGLISANGRDWTKLDAGAFSIRGEITSAAPGPDAWIAVGYEVAGGLDPDVKPALWRSDDGVVWERVDLRRSGLSDSGMLIDIAYGAAGWVAVGSSPIDNGFSQATAWTSPDGEAWTQALMPSEADRTIAYDRETGDLSLVSELCHSEALAVAAGVGGYVATGVCLPFDAIVAYATAWTSPDGLVWTQIREVQGAFDDPAYVTDISATDAGYVIAGSLLFSDRQDVTAWTSADGVTWTRENLDLQGGFSSVAANDDTLLAVGRGNGSALIFLGTINP
jgi:hypothetical protein